MGLEIPTAALIGSAAIGAGGSLLSSFSNNMTSRDNAARSNRTNMDIANNNNAMQERLNAENNQFAHDEADLAYQRELDKMAIENKYNSPIEQLKRYQEAGINPSVAFAGNLAQAASSGGTAPMAQPHGSGVTPSMPSLITPSYQSPFSFVDGLSNGLLKYAQIKNIISESGKNDAQSDQIRSTMDALLDQIKESTRGEKLTNDLQSIFGAEMYKANLSNVVQQAATSAQQALLYADQGEHEKALAELTRSQNKTEKIIADLRGQERDLMEKKNNTFYETQRAEIEKMRSESVKNRADAALSSAQLDRLREILPKEIANLDSIKDLNEAQRNKLIVDFLATNEEYQNSRLTDEQRDLIRRKMLGQLEHDLNDQKLQSLNPLRYVGWLAHPLTQEIGIALGGSANITSNFKKLPK